MHHSANQMTVNTSLSKRHSVNQVYLVYALISSRTERSKIAAELLVLRVDRMLRMLTLLNNLHSHLNVRQRLTAHTVRNDCTACWSANWSCAMYAQYASTIIPPIATFSGEVPALSWWQGDVEIWIPNRVIKYSKFNLILWNKLSSNQNPKQVNKLHVHQV